jgi:uncharacterized protein YdhG (YjbR/CyaY superfamily)
MPTKPTTAAERRAERAKLDRYFASLSPEARRAVLAIRAIVRAQARDAEERISYGIPSFRIFDRGFLWYAGWRAHASLYPLNAAMRRDHARALAGYELSKGTVRFPLDEPLPVALVRSLVRARIAELQATAKPAARKKAAKRKTAARKSARSRS